MPSHHAEILVEVTRGGMVESLHRGHIAVVDFNGKRIASAGNPDYYTFARSAAKLLQAVPLLESGGIERFDLTEEEIALCCASHNGEPQHVEAALGLLHKLGLGEGDLDCGKQDPYYKPAAERLSACSCSPSQLHNNCSGKHAGMLALARLLDAPTESYIAREHPVQRRMLSAVADLCGVEADSITLGTDGCGVPVFAVPVSALAYAYAGIGRPDRLAPERAEACRRIIQAIRRHPFYVAGTDRFDTRLVEVTRGRIIGKMGAEGIFAASIPEEGLGLALKIEDGAERASYPAAAEALRQLGLLSSSETQQLQSFLTPPVLNRRGDRVGELRPVFQLTRS